MRFFRLAEIAVLELSFGKVVISRSELIIAVDRFVKLRDRILKIAGVQISNAQLVDREDPLWFLGGYLLEGSLRVRVIPEVGIDHAEIEERTFQSLSVRGDRLLQIISSTLQLLTSFGRLARSYVV